MKKVVTISSIGNINPTVSYRTGKVSSKARSNAKKIRKIRNNPIRKGRVYND